MESFKPDAVTYEIVERVGDGLSSTVYKAVRHDSRGHSRQIVALKVLQDETMISILRREFEALVRVRSENCGRVIAWENSGGKPALVLEWIEGETLDRLPWALDDDEVTEIAIQISRGLRDLKDQGLHHGDLHPRNVLIDSSGRVRLVDFGTGGKADGDIRGAPAYLAPEIWLGAPTDHSSDLFALGAIVYDLKTSFTTVKGTRRDEQLTRIGDPLLSRDPSERRIFEKSATNSEVRMRLGEKVGRHLTTKRAPVATRVLTKEPSRRAWSMTAAASLLAALTTLSISVRAEAPLELVDRVPATLEIRSNRWLEVEINGKSAGFSPLRITNLRPGVHRLKWRGAAGSGEARLQFESGGLSRLDEAELSRLVTVLNR